MTGSGLIIDHAATIQSGQDEQPLVLLLHGYGSNEADLAGLAPHLPSDVATASLRAPLTLAAGSFSWFPIGLPGRPAPTAVAASSTAVLDWLGDHVAPGRPVVPLGFSQGGLMVTQLLRLRPERFVAGLVLSGFVLDAPLPRDEELAKRQVPVFFGRGDAEDVIGPDTTARASAWLAEHVDCTEKVYRGLGHGISMEELGDINEFLTAVLRG